ncbi:BSD [Macleaya cordata]|uniref:BSD n=1 Tax=Macleaya cordata TaxID=56857 RepID=A0A200PTR5_MACCD|nr:BSD [Macleaya cordata]
MDFSSWIRKTLLKKNKSDPTNNSNNNSIISQTVLKQKHRQKDPDDEEEEELGVTEELRDFVKSFTIETFKNFPLQKDDQVVTTSSSSSTVKSDNGSSITTDNKVQKDLSEWQERHAMLVLTKVKEISQLRYVLCPRHLKERQFWQIYFMLVKSYVAPFQMRAIQQAKLRRMSMKDEKPVDNACEVEMAEAKPSTRPPPLEHDLGSL